MISIGCCRRKEERDYHVPEAKIPKRQRREKREKNKIKKATFCCLHFRFNWLLQWQVFFRHISPKQRDWGSDWEINKEKKREIKRSITNMSLLNNDKTARTQKQRKHTKCFSNLMQWNWKYKYKYKSIPMWKSKLSKYSLCKIWTTMVSKYRMY